MVAVGLAFFGKNTLIFLVDLNYDVTELILHWLFAKIQFKKYYFTTTVSSDFTTISKYRSVKTFLSRFHKNSEVTEDHYTDYADEYKNIIN